MEECFSDFLVARPSFWEGVARILDLGNTLTEYNSHANPDEVALRMDWACVGQSIREALALYEQERKEQEAPANLSK
jgi:hypothetical protein